MKIKQAIDLHENYNLSSICDGDTKTFSIHYDEFEMEEDGIKIVENESQATHWRHVRSFFKSNLEHLELYPVRCEIVGEDTYYYISDGRDKISTEWLKQNCIGNFVVIEKQKKKSCNKCDIKDTCCDREMIEGRGYEGTV